MGHAYSAVLAHDMARRNNGTFLLRIENIDQGRSRPDWEAQIYEDLAWLGVSWPLPVMRQSERGANYQSALMKLWHMGLLYPCSCGRRDIINALQAPQEGEEPVQGPDGPVYPGTCRNRPRDLSAPPPTGHALRLDMRRAVQNLTFEFFETGAGLNGETGRISFEGAQAIDEIGDVVLARRDIGTSYHLSVVLDDAAQDVTHVVRGADLFEATKIHVILQHLLSLPTPEYHHHKLIRDDAGKRLAKRDNARAIRAFHDQGMSAEDLKKLIGLSTE